MTVVLLTYLWHGGGVDITATPVAPTLVTMTGIFARHQSCDWHFCLWRQSGVVLGSWSRTEENVRCYMVVERVIWDTHYRSGTLSGTLRKREYCLEFCRGNAIGAREMHEIVKISFSCLVFLTHISPLLGWELFMIGTMWIDYIICSWFFLSLPWLWLRMGTIYFPITQISGLDDMILVKRIWVDRTAYYVWAKA